MIYSGTLTERLDFYRVVETQTDSGYKHSDEVFMFTCYAQRLKNVQNFTVNANELFHSSSLTFHLRYKKDIDETNIVVYKEQRYRIISLDKFQNEITLTLDKINE